MRRHFDTLKQKPEHVRHQVAFGAAAGITGLVALIWAVSHAASGTFALSTQPAAEERPNLANTQTSFSNLLGAVGASLGTTPQEPELTIVDGATRTTIDAPAQNPDATVIPF